MHYMEVLVSNFFDDLGVCPFRHSHVECHVWPSITMAKVVETGHRCVQQGKLLHHSKHQMLCRTSSSCNKHLLKAPVQEMQDFYIQMILRGIEKLTYALKPCCFLQGASHL